MLLLAILMCAVLWESGIVGRISRDIYARIPFAFAGIPTCPDCNVILVSLDVLRADDLPCYGYSRNTAPNLCAFAERNTYFTRFYSVSSYTLDDHISMVTGLYPSTHHVLVPFRDSLNPSIPTLAESLQAHGYRTLYLGVTDDPNLPLDKGVGRGFTEIHRLDRSDSSLQTQLRTILPTLQDHKPTFLFVHSYLLHAPFLVGPGPRRYAEGAFPEIPLTPKEYKVNSIPFYASVLNELQLRVDANDAPKSVRRNTSIISDLSSAVVSGDLTRAQAIFLGSLYWLEQTNAYDIWYWKHIDPYNDTMIAYLRGLYDERINTADDALKPLLDFVDQPEMKRKTVVIITSDHGEEFQEHGEFGHDYNLYNTSTYIPFIIAAPKIQRSINNSLAQVTDIFPTVLDLVGIPKPRVEGKSLLPLLVGSAGATGDQYAVSEYRGTVIQSIQDGRWKLYVHHENPKAPWVELYDLVSDPGEYHNVSGGFQAVQERLTKALDVIQEKAPRYAPVIGGFPDWIDKKKQKNIIEHGYF